MRQPTGIATLVLAISAALAVPRSARGEYLVVESEYGGANPPVGTNTFEYGTLWRCEVTNSPIPLGGTNITCTGWVGTGSVPASGSGTSTPWFTLTNNSTITWVWEMQVWLSASNATPEGGFIFGGNRWVTVGTTQLMDAVSFSDYHFEGWSGDIAPSNAAARPTWLLVDEPKSVTADFVLNTTSNGTAVPPRVEVSPPGSLASFVQTFSDLALQGPVQDNLSGCTIDPHTGELIGIQNSGNRYEPYLSEGIQIYGPDGSYRRRIELPGFDDTEGICLYNAESNLYAILEEAIGLISIVELTTNTSVISKTDVLRTIDTGYSFAGTAYRNKAWEGITYDFDNDRFYLVKERNPMAVARVTGSAITPPHTDYAFFDAQAILNGICTDLADVTYDPLTGHLLLLSDESSKIIECTLDGQVVDELDLPGTTQIEGIFLSPDRRAIHLVGERAEYFRYDFMPGAAIGDEGTPWTVEMGLSRTVTNDVSVDWSITTTNATPEVDFSPVTGRVTIAAESSATNVTIQIQYDGTGEPDEHLLLSVTDATSATIGRGLSAIYTIAANSSADPTTDSDGDGLPDEWEMLHFGATNAVSGGPLDDWDGDSFVNADEFAAGTDPTNSASLLMLINVEADSQAVTVSWQSVTSRTYALYRVTDLVSAPAGAPVASGIAGHASGTNRATDSSTAPQAYYRIGVDSQP